MAKEPRGGAAAAASSDDIVIIGGGLAGLFCALKLSPRPVTVLAAAPIGHGASSAWAQGGIAAAMAEGDTFEKHLADTLAAGAGIVDEEITRGVVSEAPARIHDLLSFGVPFDRDLEGHLQLSREAAHSERRIVRVRGDMAGKAIMEALIAVVRRTPSIHVVENAVAEEIVTADGAVSGVRIRAEAGRAARQLFVPAKAVVLASGGIGHLYAVTTNPAEARGGGLGMAARAGAVIADPEFVQFHPTAIDVGRDPAPLATEALRGDGSILVNRAGHRFMLDIHPDGELAPRDIVARGIFAEVVAGRGAFLDTRIAIGAAFPERFPTVYGYCVEAGIDPVTHPIPVVPAVHYHMGGVLTDAKGRTSLAGLWACGEVASTGVHGANRLASNSLLEAVVFAARIAEDLAGRFPDKAGGAAVPVEEAGAVEDAAPDSAAMRKLRALMSHDVGVVRNADGLAHAVREIETMTRRNRSLAFRNQLAAAQLIAVAALKREESRGGHYRSDFPDPVDAWQHRTTITLTEAEAAAGAVAGQEAA
ncbi:L-aspartate oxidase [Mangrovicella endophytica]|uniref:L-aspartate oxidase n=1 Tax=Mangrovicella endophytica TaxID=2066697 RepID=UPI000C9EB3B6|nr:L-aspartate oxidase [Mangrovicella endophytica]